MPELMVSVGIIALLIALLVPGLAAARRQAATIKSLANARQLAIVVDQYAERSRGSYPCITEGRFYPTTGGLEGQFRFPYWQVWQTWTGVIFDDLPYMENVEVYISPTSTRLSDPGIPWPSSYSYSTSFVGAPELWAAGAAPDPTLRRGMRLSDVLYPSSKVLLWDGELAWEPRPRHEAATGDSLDPTPMIFADGSGGIRVPADATEPIPNPFEHAVSHASLHNTPDGVRGRDY